VVKEHLGVPDRLRYGVAGTQPVVLWQSSQALLDGMCPGFLPSAMTPLWQLKQVPMTDA
jgi:hypothetical protein